MKLYHRTYHSRAILEQGFKDSEGFYGTAYLWSGVWFSAYFPLDVNEGADGDVVLTIEVPEEKLEYYEWVEEGKPYREFLIPAELANRYGPPSIFEEE